MIGRRAIAVATGSILLVAVASNLVLAQGFGGHPGGHGMWLLARAGGLNRSQITTQFANDSNLATDRSNLKSAHDAMMSCMVSSTVSSTGCSNQIASYSSALQTMAQERMTVWQNLFKTASNLPQAASVYSQLQQLHSQKQQILQSVLGSPAGDTGTQSSAAPNE
jgi:hypothetical protein